MTNTYSITPINAFDDNYIWCLAKQQQAIVVDPGDAEPVLAHLQANNLSLAAILITHHHHDHTGGIEKLKQAYPDVLIAGPSHSPSTGITQALDDNDQLTVMDIDFDVMAIPGHTLDHVAYYDATDGNLFCGDTLFLAGCGRVFEGTMEQMHTALQRLMALPPETTAFPTHEYSLANLAFAAAVEPENNDIKGAIVQCQQQRAKQQPTLPTKLATEALINPFVRCHQPSVIVAANQRAETQLTSQTEVFATIREWKNNF